MNNDIRLYESFLSEEECKYFIDFALNSNNWSSGGKDWEDRILFFEHLDPDSPVREKAMVIASKIKDKIINDFNIRDIWPDTIHVVRWPEGSVQEPHADSVWQDGTPNISSWRSFGSIIYLNDDFDGGKTYYTNYEYEVEPKIGSLLIHSANLKSTHGVTQVGGGTRYTIASFWTTDVSRSVNG